MLADRGEEKRERRRKREEQKGKGQKREEEKEEKGMTPDLSLLSGFAGCYYHCMYVTRVCIRVRGSYLVKLESPHMTHFQKPQPLSSKTHTNSFS